MEFLVNIVCSVVSIENIMFVRLLCGLYYKVSTNELILLAVRIYCVICSTVCVQLRLSLIILMYKGHLGSQLSILMGIILYTINVITNLMYDGENFFLFRKNILNLDFLLTARPVEDMPVSKLLFIVLVLHKAVSTILIYINLPIVNMLTITYVIFSGIFMVAITLSSITKVMMFESLHHRMKLLRKLFERNLAVGRRFENGENITIDNLYKCMNIYKNLLYTVKVSDTPMKFMTFCTNVATIPTVLILVYEIMYNTLYYKQSKINILETVASLLIPFIPGIFVELNNSEIEKMRLCVVKQLLVYRGENFRDAVIDSVKYFDNCPFKYTIWRIFTVDLTLLFTMIGLITTYTVAMIQFTHIFDSSS